MNLFIREIIMKKPNQIKDLAKKLLENFIIQLMVGLLILSGVIYTFKNWILFSISYIQQTNFPLWMTLVIALAVIFLIQLSKSLPEKKHGPLIFPFRTRNGNEQEILFSYNNLKWIAFIPKQLFEPDEYVWLTGPFCPICAYELKWKKKIIEFWHCERCNKNFNTFRKTEYDERSFVKNMVHADIFTKKKFQK